MTRRIDITLERLDELVAGLAADQQAKLAGPDWSWWSVIVTVARLRAMERAEAEVISATVETLADAYDQIVQPGEHAVEAIFRTFKAVYGLALRSTP